MTTPAPLGRIDAANGSVHLRTTLPAAAATVWAALTERDQLAAWLGAVEHGRFGPGEAIVLLMEPDADPPGRAACTVTTWRPPYELVLDWRYTGEARPSRVRFTLTDADSGRGTVLEVEHSLLTVELIEYIAGWHRGLDSLRCVVTGVADPARPTERQLLASYAAAR
jgi:uncharacterized protein YndB with AHSA1/START domain